MILQILRITIDKLPYKLNDTEGVLELQQNDELNISEIGDKH